MTTIKIGVVEDEMIIAATIVSTLKKLNYEVVNTASNYNAAIDMIEKEELQLLLLDINLGGQKDGIDSATYVRSHYELPIIFFPNGNPQVLQVSTFTLTLKHSGHIFIIK